MNIVLCDDNLQFLKVLENAIREQYAYIFPPTMPCHIGPLFDSGDKVLEYAKSHTIDVVFLDVDMPVMNGFDLAKIICNDYPQTMIVFVSAYDNFVYDSFQYAPIAYLRKNYITQELPQTVTRILEKVTKQQQQLSFNAQSGEVLLSVRDILYFESNKNYYIIYCENGDAYRCRGSISKAEERISVYDFFRIHAGYLVNLEKIDRIDKNTIIMGQKKLPIASKRLSEFKRAYMSYTRRDLNR